MIYPKNFEEKIGFSQIREMIKTECISTLGAALVEKMSFQTNISKIERLLNQTNELQSILLNGEHFPNQDYFDIYEYLDTIKTPGRYVEAENLSEIRAVLNTINQILLFLKNRDKTLPEVVYLNQLAAPIFVDLTIIRCIDKVIDDKSQIKDNASEKLHTIRKELEVKHRQSEKRIVTLLKKAINDGLIPSDTQLTVRNGRSVIPIPSSNKRILHGFIHDESATGQTSYIEPSEIFELNNEIVELKYQEKREIIKILTEVADEIRPSLESISVALNFLSVIDFIRAKAKFSIRIKAKIPAISTEDSLYLNKASHPLLYLNNIQQKKATIPLTIRLDKENRIVLISGPNAGGKSVCLKTIGLLQYMFQCGLPLSAEEDSSMRIFNNLFIDIGDEQSIENDLSTYSSHLRNMNQLLRNADSSTLFLIDEFGAGTEPSLGGAIAESILDALNRKNALGVANTHFANLKHFAEQTNGIVNAAMLFDTKNMYPLYILDIGKPGSSYAFEIAQNIGLPKEIIDLARNKVGSTHYNYDKQLKELEFEAIKLGQRASEIDQKDRHLKSLIAQYEDLKRGNDQLKANIEKSKTEILNKAKIDALDIIQSANTRIEESIRDIKENKAEKVKTKEIRVELEKAKEEIKQSIIPIKKATETVDNTPIKEGDYVKIEGNSVVGKVISIKKDMAFVEFGSFKSSMDIKKLEKSNKNEHKKSQKPNYSDNIVKNISDKQTNFKSQLDIRGKRAEEVYTLLQQFIDEAVLLSVRDITILHGKGNGILREVVRQYLGVMNDVDSYKDEDYERGGPGITVVKLRSSL
ncbi:MAG: Smr/MutS family protein [Bacteroidota bacterium]